MYSTLAYSSRPAAAPRFLTSRCVDCPCRSEGICASPDVLPSKGTFRRLRRGDTLVWADEPTRDIFNIVSGALKLVARSADGDERGVGILLPGDFVGDPHGGAHALTAVAMSETIVCAHDQRAIERLLDQSPEFARTFLRRTIADLDQARRWVMMTGGRSAAARVASLLAALLARADDVGQRVAIPFSRGDMAELLGLSLETVSRRVHRLARDGVIALPDRRGFRVLDPGRLSMIAAG